MPLDPKFIKTDKDGKRIREVITEKDEAHPDNPKFKELVKHEYADMTVDEMRVANRKPRNAEIAEALGIKVYNSWSEKKICEAIFKHFNK